MFAIAFCSLLVLPAGAGGTSPVESDVIVASDPEVLSKFGFAVAIDGSRAVFGAYDDDTAAGQDAGSAYVFERDASGAWTEVAKLEASDGKPFDEFGYSVAVHEDTVVVGAHNADPALVVGAGSAYVFERDQGGANAWGEVAKLVASNPVVKGRIGASVAIHGDTIAVGAPRAPGVYVFDRDAGGANAWGQVRSLSEGLAVGQYGDSLDLEGDLLLVGAPGQIEGRAYLYQRDFGGSNQWGELVVFAKKRAFWLGRSVALSGTTVVIGAPATKVGTNSQQGAAYVYDQGPAGPSAWNHVATLHHPQGEASDQFGDAVALDGDVVVVGAYRDSHSGLTQAGSAHWFERDPGGSGGWEQVGTLTASSASTSEHYGGAVAVGGSLALVGSHRSAHAGVGAGAVFVNEVWTTGESYCTAGSSAGGCQALMSVAGVASATAISGFDLVATTVEGNKDGLFFYGTNGRQANPWGSGTSYVCVIPPRLRSGLFAGSGSAGNCDGSFTTDLNARWCATCPKPAHNPGAGATMQAQLWYRDPQNTSNQTSGMSDAIEFCIEP
jgi:hypothetical protein